MNERPHIRSIVGQRAPWGLVAAMVVLLVGAYTTVASAQLAPAPSASAAPAPAKIEEIAAADILGRAEEDEQYIASVAKRARGSRAHAEQLDQTLARQAAKVQDLFDQSNADDLARLSVARLESLRRHWLLYQRQVARTRADLVRATEAASEATAGLARRRTAWQMTRDADSTLAPPLLRRVDEILAQIEVADSALSEAVDRLIRLRRKDREVSLHLESGLSAVVEQIAQEDRELLEIEAPPLWRAQYDEGSYTGQGLGSRLAIETKFGKDYDADNEPWLRLTVVTCVLLFPLMLWLRRRALRLVSSQKMSADDMHALSRPGAAWLIMTALGVALYNLQGPTIREQAVLLLAWVPVLRLLPTRVLVRVGPWAYASASFYFLNVALSIALTSNLLLYRYLLVTLDLLMLAAIGWLIVRTQRAAVSKGGKPLATAFAKAVLSGAATIVFVAVVSNVLGNVSLTTMLTSALLNSSYAAVVLFACVTVVVALGRVLLARPSLARLASRHTASRAIHAAKRLGGIAIVVAWATVTLGEFRIRDPLVDRLSAILAHEFSLGLVSISLGGVVVFFGAAWIAFWVAKTVRLLLSEDILPALSLPRGVANSISTLSSYGVLLVGLLMSLAAAGYQVKQLTLVFGALGVGIGFGLQDIVKNFVSGLILMVERPIQPGDAIDVAGVQGHVREIGMRATSVTTFEGAELIVPNGKLLEDRLVNWTLVSSQRRFDVIVTTSFATAPQHTIELLDRLAASVEGVAQHPAPSTVLNGLGAGALEFNVRAWTVDKADWVTVRSALAVRLRDGLAEAGIVVPAPRWTLEMQPHTGPAAVAASENQERAGLAAHPTEDRQAK